jgi:hypothetical protein
LVSFQIYAGIAGFNRGALSMPSWLRHYYGGRFAYCLDSQNKSNKILLGDKAILKDISLIYTPFLINPIVHLIYSKNYFVGLKGVSIDGK